MHYIVFLSQMYSGYTICELHFNLLTEPLTQFSLFVFTKVDLTKVTEPTDVPGFVSLSIFHSLSINEPCI